MKIAVLNGSPKGNVSVSLQYVKYIEKCFPAHHFHLINVARQVRKIEKQQDYFNSILDEIATSDSILWSFPVYYFLVPSQLKRFIELVLQGGRDAFKGKYATAISTSGHMLDNTAHNYIHAISEDLHMKYVEGYSAGGEDLTVAKERENLCNFAKLFFYWVEAGLPTERKFAPVLYDSPEFVSGEIPATAKTGTRRVTVVHDADGDVNLPRMIDVFKASIDAVVDIVNIHDINMRGGCLGCLHCTQDGVCVQKDDYGTVIKERVLPADAVILAGSVRDRYLSSVWKRYIDRFHFLGHGPFLSGKQIGFLISGPLRQIPNLRQILEGLADNSGANLVGMVSDEYEDSGLVTSLIRGLARRTELSIDSRSKKPPTYLGAGVHKLVRDMVYEYRWLLRADHVFFTREGLYDFPQRNVSARLKDIVMRPLLKIPRVRRWFYKNLWRLAVQQHQRIIKQVQQPKDEHPEVLNEKSPRRSAR